MDESTLRRYLNDHLSGSEAATRLLSRLSRQHRRSALGAFLAGLLSDVRADQRTLAGLARRVGARRSLVKHAAGRLAAVASRAKLHGHRHDQLGLFESLEMLALGILGKRSLWQALRQIAPLDGRFSARELARLEARAVDQHARIEARRLALARTILVAPLRRQPA